MDTKLVVHAGAELVIIGGMFVYFNKQMSALKTTNDVLVKRMEVLEKVLHAHDEMLGSLVSPQTKRSPRRTAVHKRQSRPPPPKEEDAVDEETEEEYDEGELDEEINDNLGDMSNETDVKETAIEDQEEDEAD